MESTLEQFLEQVARRGSWVGGGSVAAVGAALSAALLEKLVPQPAAVRRFRRVRRDCLKLVARDAQAFAAVIRAMRQQDQPAVQRALKQATEIPWQVFQHAQTVQAACRSASRLVKPRFQADLRCAMALAKASAESAKILIKTNLDWLRDPAYTLQMRQRLATASNRNGG